MTIDLETKVAELLALADEYASAVDAATNSEQYEDQRNALSQALAVALDKHAGAGRQPAPCRDCNGSGEVMQMTWGHGPDDYEYPVSCKTCDGTGEASREAPPAPALAAPRVWPFVESPGEFAFRLANAYQEFGGDWIAAVRCVLIERPAVLAEGHQSERSET